MLGGYFYVRVAGYVELVRQPCALRRGAFDYLYPVKFIDIENLVVTLYDLSNTTLLLERGN